MATMEQQVESIVDTILEDYRNGRSIDRMNPFAHPDKEVVIDMIGKLMRIVYPGFSRDKNYRIYNTHHNLSMLIEDVMYNMVKQLTMVFRADMEEQQAQEKAQQVSLDFFRAIPALRDVIQTDVEAFYDGDPAAYSTDEIVYCYPGIFAITVYRLAHVLYAMGVPLLPRIMTEHAHSETGIDINPGAAIGKYFFIDHGTGIVIGETTVIGDHVKVYQGVTLGALTTRGGQSLRGKRRHPTIEDNVTIYAGASHSGRRYGHWPGLRHRLQCLYHPFHSPLHHGQRQEPGTADSPAGQLSGPILAGREKRKMSFRRRRYAPETALFLYT